MTMGLKYLHRIDMKGKKYRMLHLNTYVSSVAIIQLSKYLNRKQLNGFCYSFLTQENFLRKQDRSSSMYPNFVKAVI